VIELLENDDLLTRTRYGPVTDVRWRAVLTRWIATSTAWPSQTR